MSTATNQEKPGELEILSQEDILTPAGIVRVLRVNNPKLIEDDDVAKYGMALMNAIREREVSEDEKPHSYVLCFAGVDSFSTAAMGKIIRAHRHLYDSKRQLVLLDIRPEIYEVFAITKLNRIFEIKDSLEGYLAQLGGRVQKPSL